MSVFNTVVQAPEQTRIADPFIFGEWAKLRGMTEDGKFDVNKYPQPQKWKQMAKTSRIEKKLDFESFVPQVLDINLPGADRPAAKSREKELKQFQRSWGQTAYCALDAQFKFNNVYAELKNFVEGTFDLSADEEVQKNFNKILEKMQSDVSHRLGHIARISANRYTSYTTVRRDYYMEHLKTISKSAAAVLEKCPPSMTEIFDEGMDKVKPALESEKLLKDLSHKSYSYRSQNKESRFDSRPKEDRPRTKIKPKDFSKDFKAKRGGSKSGGFRGKRGK